MHLPSLALVAVAALAVAYADASSAAAPPDSVAQALAELGSSCPDLKPTTVGLDLQNVTAINTLAGCKKASCLDLMRELIPTIDECYPITAMAKRDLMVTLAICEQTATAPLSQDALIQLVNTTQSRVNVSKACTDDEKGAPVDLPSTAPAGSTQSPTFEMVLSGAPVASPIRNATTSASTRTSVAAAVVLTVSTLLLGA